MHFTDFDAVLFDMDGTLYHQHHGLPGARDTIAHLRRVGLTFACITNNSANTAEELSQRLARLDIDVEPSLIYTAAMAMADLIVERWDRPRVYYFAGWALPQLLQGKATIVEADLSQPAQVVAVGTHFRENGVGFSYERALLGLEHLRRGAHLVAGCADRVFPVIGGGVEFGSGAWGSLFAFGAALPADHVHHAGKPEPEFFRHLCDRLGVQPRRCLLIGDNLESDIAGGQGVGMATALLFSGVTRPEDLRRSHIKPNAVFDDLASLLAAMR